jgi:hypothetical protein
MEFEVLLAPLAVIERVYVPVGVRVLDDPPHATMPAVNATPAITTIRQNRRLTIKRLLRQHRLRPPRQVGSHTTVASSMDGSADGRSMPTVPMLLPAVVMVSVLMTEVFDPSAVTVAGVRANLFRDR